MPRKPRKQHLPHKGTLCKFTEDDKTTYCISIDSHELRFTQPEFEFCRRVFTILDTESQNCVSRQTVRDFVTTRCVVISKRDEALGDACTFDELGEGVGATDALGLEGWMVFCKFLALSQYLEAKRRFSSRHLQQTMRHRNAPRGSEVVVVDVPPPQPPEPLSWDRLVAFEHHQHLPTPELDIDHSCLAVHDQRTPRPGRVRIAVYGKSPHLEFAVTYQATAECVVRRSMEDIQWLDQTFRSHKSLGGTLCGRILPICPQEDVETPIELAVSGRIRNAAKSLLGYPREKPKAQIRQDNSEAKARQLERYLAYILEHPALSTSFPLHAVLTASQSGMDAARQIIADSSVEHLARQQQTPQMEDGKPVSSNFAWVRTAAQAAMALQLHGILETTGLQSASAKLQHASLPDFGPQRYDEEPEPAEANPSRREASNFEEGVVNDDGYDLLPLPVPAPERRILTVGAPASESSVITEERFHYGMGALDDRVQVVEEEDGAGAFLADISVDENIDKLRDVIGSVDSTLSRCLASVGGTSKARRRRQQLHLDIVNHLDSWPEMRGKFVSQRSLMKGVAGITQSKELFEEGEHLIADDLSWQVSLAGAAVSAAEEVRAAVRASRTASNARAAASAAALSAQTACEKGEFGSLDEARAAQTRASIAQSHAIHAAVVEHEASTMKRRSTMALVHDVKTWNVHRKREMLRSCMQFARSQYEATRRSVDAWSSLRDGFVGKSVSPSIVERRAAAPVPSESVSSMQIPQPVADAPATADADEVKATIFPSASDGSTGIVAIDHSVLTSSSVLDVSQNNSTEEEASTEEPPPPPPRVPSSAKLLETPSEDEEELPFAEAAPIPPGMLSEKEGDGEKLSASMQSLVDGLMTWGGGFDAEDDLALPSGMAANIAFESMGQF